MRTAQKPVVLLFTSPECGPCTDLLPEIGRWHEEHSEEFTISLVSHLSAEENRAKIAEHGLEDNVLLQRDWEVAETYGTETTPSAVLIPTLAHCQFATIAVLTVLAYFQIQQLADNIPSPPHPGPRPTGARRDYPKILP